MNSSVYLRALFLSFLIVILGVIGSYILSSQVKSQFQSQQYSKLESLSRQAAARFQDSIDAAFHDLRTFQAFYSVGDEPIPENKFVSYMQTIDIESITHIQALSWVPLVLDEQRNEFEQEIRRDFSEFSITERNQAGKLVPSKTKDYYLPVTNIAPYSVNRAAHGFDLNSNTIRRRSLEQARDSGNMAATAKITLVQEKGNSYGFLIIAPVYSPASTLETLEQRQSALRGYVTGVFRINSLIQSSLQQVDGAGLVLSLIDLDEENGGLLYGVNSGVFDFEVKVAERRWLLKVGFTETLQTSISSPTIVNWVLFGGVFSSLLLALCVYALQIVLSNKQQIKKLSNQQLAHNTILEKKVAERTEKLEQKNSLLNDHIEQLTQQRKILKTLTNEAEHAKEAAESREIELARSNRDLDDFAYIASHDLKAPLRGIDQLARWVSEDIEAGDMNDVSENLGLLRQRVQRLETLLNDLLAYSRVNKGPRQLTMVDTKALVKDMYAMVSPSPDFQLVLEGEFPTFETISAPFEQVVRNLLSNTIMHHDKSSGIIQVSCKELEQHYQFSVIDDGPGIHPDFHEHVFKMFKTLKPRDEVEGSGMGLALIERIVKQYDGSVSLQSVLGEGSTFCFTWPKTL